jgi:hypothetical protein
MTLKAFRLNETEAWAGTDLEDAIAKAMAESEAAREDVYDTQYGEQLTADYVVTDGEGKAETVAELLKGIEEFPDEGHLVCEFTEGE